MIYVVPIYESTFRKNHFFNFRPLVFFLKYLKICWGDVDFSPPLFLLIVCLPLFYKFNFKHPKKQM